VKDVLLDISLAFVGITIIDKYEIFIKIVFWTLSSMFVTLQIIEHLKKLLKTKK
jgi:hypothetical protein